MKHQNNLHVVYIITKLELGGAQKVCLSLMQGITQAGITSSLISGKEGILASAVNDAPNILLLESLTREVAWQAFLQEIRCFIALVKHLRKLKKQHPNLLVHTHSTKAGIMGRWAAWCAGIRLRLHTIHGFGFHNHQNKCVKFAVYCSEFLTSFITSHFICVSSADIQIGRRYFPRFAKNSSLIRAAVDWQSFTTLSPRSYPKQVPQPFIFGTIACFKPQKNLGDLIRAFAYVTRHNPHVKLEIIGDGILRPHLEHLIAHYHLTKNVKLHGWQHDVRPFMHQWHAFTLSSLWEGLPCSIVEARLLQLPVICYNTGGISDIIAHGHNGLLIPQGKWQELADAMLRVSRDTTLYQSLCTHPDNLADFNDQEMINQHGTLYKKLATNR